MKMLQYNKKINIYLLAFLLFALCAGSTVASAGTLNDAFDKLKGQYPDFITKLTGSENKYRCTEAEVEAFVNDMSSRLSVEELTEENFNEKVMNAGIALLLDPKHQNFANAFFEGYNINSLSEEGIKQALAGFAPMKVTLMNELLSPNENQPPGGGGSIGTLTENSKAISAATGGSLSISGVTVDVPADVLPGDATLSIKKLDTTEVESVVPSGLRLKLGSEVYEIDTTGDRNFSKDITIRLPFDPAKIADGEQPVANYFDGTRWVEISGTVEGSEVVVNVNHLTKFAVFSTKATKIFADITGHWAQQDIEVMLDRGLVNGVSATEFEPERSVTRAEFAALLVRALGIPYEAGLRSSFADVSSDAWYSAVVAAATGNGLVNGYSATTFGPEEVITREQMAVMVMRALQYAGKGAILTEAEVNTKLAIFDDKQDISAWAQEDVAGVAAKNIVKGRTASTFVPQGTATRAEAAVMILRMLN